MTAKFEIISIYRDKTAFEKDLPRILTFINENFGLELLIKVLNQQHNEVKNNIIETVLKSGLNSTNSKKTEFLTQLSSKLDSTFGSIINDVLNQSPDEDITKALICYANSDLINR